MSIYVYYYLSYPVCKAHAPYYNVMACMARQYFSSLSHKWHELKKKLLNIKYLF